MNQTKQIVLHGSSVYPKIFLLAESYCQMSFLSLACKISATIRQPPSPPLHALFKTKCILSMVLPFEFIKFVLSEVIDRSHCNKQGGSGFTVPAPRLEMLRINFHRLQWKSHTSETLPPCVIMHMLKDRKQRGRKKSSNEIQF